MTKFLAVLLTAREGAVSASVDPRTPFAADLGESRSAALLVRAVTRARREPAADEVLEARLAAAMRETAGVKAMEDAGLVAWEQRGGAS